MDAEAIAHTSLVGLSLGTAWTIELMVPNDGTIVEFLQLNDGRRIPVRVKTAPKPPPAPASGAVGSGAVRGASSAVGAGVGAGEGVGEGVGASMAPKKVRMTVPHWVEASVRLWVRMNIAAAFWAEAACFTHR